MLNDEGPAQSSVLSVPARATEVVLSDDTVHPFSLILPPIEELAEVSVVKARVSAYDATRNEKLDLLAKAFGLEYERELEKLETHGSYSTYHSRLAELAFAAGRLDEQEGHLSKAKSLSTDSYFDHKQIDLLVSKHQLSAAEDVALRLHLDTDVYANLRMAMFRLYQNRQDDAFRFVEHAYNIDALDYRVRMFEGGICLLRGEFDRAIRAFRAASWERPTSCVIFTNLAIAYVRVGQVEKAFSSLRRAVALGPLNINAICMLADLAHEHSRDEEAVPALRHILTYERKQPELWGRFARACIELNLYDEAVTSLRHEAAIAETSTTWNNMGVSYGLQGDTVRAQQCFKRAIKLAGEVVNREFLLAARNMAQAMVETEKPLQVTKFIDAVLSADHDREAIKSDDIAQIYALKVLALGRADREDEAQGVALECVNADDCNSFLRAWAVGFVVARDALWQKNLERIPKLVSLHLGDIELFARNKKLLRVHTLNNIAFALAEVGLTEEAERILGLNGEGDVRNQAYPLATLGLIQMRRGNVEKGQAKYEQAISTAVGRLHKTRIRQKLNFEMAKIFASSDPKKAKRLLERIVEERHGEPALSSVAARQLQGLPKPVAKTPKTGANVGPPFSLKSD